MSAFLQAEVTLSADEAQGGDIAVSADGRKAVRIAPSTAPEGGYSWKLSESLPSGWWEVTVEFAPVAGDSQRQVLEFVSGFKSLCDLNEVEQAQVGNFFHFWFYTNSAIQTLAVHPGRIMPQSTRAITQIKFKEATVPLMQNEPILLHLDSSNRSSIELPKGLPSGNWKITTYADGSKISPGMFRVVGEKSEIIKASLSNLIPIFTTEPIRAIAWDSDAKFTGVLLQYVTRYHPRIPLRSDVKSQPVIYADQVTRNTLVLKASGPIKELPSLPILPSGKKMAVITSWDDGIESDVQCAELLNKHGFKGTFFVNDFGIIRQKFLGKLEELGMEIGSHSVNHPRAWLISPKQWDIECSQLRTDLEQALGHPVLSFAYPCGYVPAFDADGDYVLRGVRKAGFWSARTANIKAETVQDSPEPLLLATSGHFLTPLGKFDALWNQAKEKEGSVFYFWGHTYEIKVPKGWDYFESLLARYENKPEAWYTTQGQLFLWNWIRANTQIEKIKEDADGLHIALTHPKLNSYLEKHCPLSIKIPSEVTHVYWNDKDVPISNGYVTLSSESKD